MEQVLIWLETTSLSQTVGESVTITAWLSALHLIGFTLVMSAGVVCNLRTMGLVLTDLQVESIAGPATRLLIAGLTISLLTGFAMFAPRATYTVASGAFQLKMVLLLVAALYQLTLGAKVLGRSDTSWHWRRASGLSGLILWLALAVTACWFILFE